MAAQKGKDLLVKIDPTGNGTFTTVAGLRARKLTFNASTVDITNQDSANQWRELLAAAGTRHSSVTGSGVFKDAASDAMLQAAFFNGTLNSYQIVIPAFGTMQGTFQVATLEFSGRHDNELAFDITMESAGEIVFTPLPLV